MSDYYEELKLAAARKVYRLHRQGKKPKRAKDWPTWWEARYGDGQTFEEYVNERRHSD